MDLFKNYLLAKAQLHLEFSLAVQGKNCQALTSTLHFEKAAIIDISPMQTSEHKEIGKETGF